MSKMPINLYTLAEDEQWNSVDKMPRVQMENVAERLAPLGRLLGFAEHSLNDIFAYPISEDQILNCHLKWGIGGGARAFLLARSGSILLSRWVSTTQIPIEVTLKEACSLYALMTGEEL